MDVGALLIDKPWLSLLALIPVLVAVFAVKLLLFRTASEQEESTDEG